MSWLLGLLALPVLGPPGLVHLVATTVANEVERELWGDEERIRGDLLELQERYDAGEVEEEEFEARESDLLERLSVARELKAA